MYGILSQSRDLNQFRLKYFDKLNIQDRQKQERMQVE